MSQKNGGCLMDIPITGFVFEPGKDDRQHSHQLYITSWDGVPVHAHAFKGFTSYDVGHRHAYAGTTAPAPSGVPHTHEYYTVTTLDDGHSHIIVGVTGPEISFPGGGHYHLFKGVTSISGTPPHPHAYSGSTSA
jgi:hypothetical protein